VYFQFASNPDGSFTVTPKVLVERQSKPSPNDMTGDDQTPTNYWYAIRRDAQMEVAIVSAIRVKLEKELAISPTTR
jgi:hypothetical protein